MYPKFEELKKYFLELPSQNVLSKSNNHSFIPLEWIFTELVDRDIIKQALKNLMKNEQLFDRPINNVDGFEVIRNKGRLLFKAVANNGKDKVSITDDESLIEEDYYNRPRTISFSELRDEIRNVLGNKNLDEANSKLIVVGLEKAFDDACGNLLNYYKYLLQARAEHAKREGIISQRSDTTTHNRTGETQIRVPRQSELIEFEERKSFLEGMNPNVKITINEADKDENLYPAYSVYMYKGNLLKDSENTKDGYLFIAEPINGDRGTRIFYFSEKEFEEYAVEQGEDKITNIVKEYLEMSKKEFTSKEKGTCILVHTDMETYKQRLAFYKNATKSESLTNLKTYLKTMSRLYGEEISLPYYRPKTLSDIERLTSGVHQLDTGYRGKGKEDPTNQTKDGN